MSGAHTGHGHLLVHDRSADRGITFDVAVVAAYVVVPIGLHAGLWAAPTSRYLVDSGAAGVAAPARQAGSAGTR